MARSKNTQKTKRTKKMRIRKIFVRTVCGLLVIAVLGAGAGAVAWKKGWWDPPWDKEMMTDEAKLRLGFF